MEKTLDPKQVVAGIMTEGENHPLIDSGLEVLDNPTHTMRVILKDTYNAAAALRPLARRELETYLKDRPGLTPTLPWDPQPSPIANRLIDAIAKAGKKSRFKK